MKTRTILGIVVVNALFIIGGIGLDRIAASSWPAPHWSRVCVQSHAELWAVPTTLGSGQSVTRKMMLTEVCDARAFKCVPRTDDGAEANGCAALPMPTLVPMLVPLPSSAPALHGGDTAL